MSTSGFLKLSGICVGLLLAGACFFAINASRSPEEANLLAAGSDTTGKKTDSAKAVRDLNETAFFLAGMISPRQPGNFQQGTTSEWKVYASRSDSNWTRFFKRKLNPVATWRQKEIPEAIDSVKTLFYPFSGPDFIFADAFFPKADRYILFGLESPGNIPDISTWKEHNLKSSLAVLNRSIDDVTSIGFFRTNDMKVELASSSIHGVTPILMLFLARSGHTINDVIPGKIDTNGVFLPLKEFQNEEGEKGYGTAVEINFTENQTGEQKSLLYFSADISDKGLAKNPGCSNFLGLIPSNCLTFIKSASYLMHLSGFSVIRKTILAKSRFILQDDSGLPYRAFKQGTWQIKLFGTYSRTIELFKNKYQEDLKEAYDNEEKKGAVPFKIGYNVKFNETNLQMATRKNILK